jgi:hypothetical protein
MKNAETIMDKGFQYLKMVFCCHKTVLYLIAKQHFAGICLHQKQRITHTNTT